MALRMARSKRSPTLSIVTLLSIGGVAIGVLSLTVVLGVTGGFEKAFQDRILGLYPHLVVHRGNSEIVGYRDLVNRIEQVEGVVGATPVTFDDMMLAAGVHRAGAVIKGIDPESADRVIGIQGLLQDGARLTALNEDLLLRHEGHTIVLSTPVANTWNTLLVSPRGVVTWVEDRTPPPMDRSRVVLVDARQSPGGEPLSLVWMDGLEQPASTTHPLRAPQLDTPGTGRVLSAGTWRIEPGGQVLTLAAGEVVTLVRRGVGSQELLVLRASKRPPLSEEEAMVRVIRADLAAPDFTLVVDGEEVFGALKAGAASSFRSLHARLPGVLLGVALAKKLQAKVGDALSLVTPLRGIDNKMVGPYGMMPSSARHRVVGIFNSGFHDYDVRLAFVHIQAAQRFLNRGDVVRWIEVTTDNLFELEALKSRVRSVVDPYDYETLVGKGALLSAYVRDIKEQDWGPSTGPPASFGEALAQDLRQLTLLRFQERNVGYHPEFRLLDWKELNQNLFSALKLQKVVLAMFFLIIIVVGCFVVVGSQVMVIHDKGPDIAILRTMGARRSVVGCVFALQGLMVSSIGVVLGLLGGVGICLGIQAYDYRLDASIYLIEQLPVQVVPSELVGVALVTLACTLAAVTYTAWQASRKTPVDGLRTLD